MKTMCRYCRPSFFLFLLICVCLLLDQGCVSPPPIDVYEEAQSILRKEYQAADLEMYMIGSDRVSPTEWALLFMVSYGQQEDLPLLIPYLFDSETRIQLKATIAYWNILQRMNDQRLRGTKRGN